jgi:hypothetical protein
VTQPSARKPPGGSLYARPARSIGERKSSGLAANAWNVRPLAAGLAAANLLGAIRAAWLLMLVASSRLLAGA